MAKPENEEKVRDGITRRVLTLAAWGTLGAAAGHMFELAFPALLPAHWVAAGAGSLLAALGGASVFRAYRRSPGAILAGQLREANRLFKDGQLSKREFEHLRASIIRQYNP